MKDQGNDGGGPDGVMLDNRHYYRDMLFIRRFEEKCGQLYGMGLIHGFCHLYIGQEAVAVGMLANTRRALDSIITGYRDHAHMLVCGADPKAVMAELMGRSGGAARGKGGSMHLFDPRNRFFGGHGIVGAQVSLGTGLAFAHKYRGDGGVCLTFFGDGAVNQGQVYESFNMAALWKLPVVYVIENNRYAMGTSVERASASTELFRRGMAYNIPGKTVDGMDFFAVREAGAEAVAHARAQGGPFILEMNTYRYRGHSMSDPAKYRPREEVAEVRERRDPIERMRERLLAGGAIGEDELKAIDREVKAIVADAADFAQANPEAAASELLTDVFVKA